MKNWIKGIPYEEAFWRSLYRNKNARMGLLNWSKYGKEICLPGFDAVAFIEECRNVDESTIVLDVGCGMSYCSGNYANGKSIDIHYVDPLAFYYNRILSDYKIDLPNVEFGMIEYLSSFYPNSDVSLIMVQNALDHSSNPIKGIKECLDSLKIGGVLYLKHYVNEAEFENYRGFHQFNVDERNGDLIIWNLEETYNVRELFGDIVEIETKRINYENRIQIISVLKKNKKQEIDFNSLKKDIEYLCQSMIDVSESMNNTGYMFRYHLSIWLYRIGHFFMKLLSYQTKMKIKAMFNKVTGKG